MATTMRDWLFAGIYLAPCRFANVAAFVAGVEPYLPLDVVVPAGAATEMLRRAATALDGDGDCPDDGAAARRLTAVQLRELAEAPLTLSNGRTEHTVTAAAGPLRNRLADAGLDVAAMTVSVGSVYPEPFAGSGRASIPVGRAEAARHQMEAGVYLLLSRLRPFSSVTRAARGLVHAAAAAARAGGSGRGLEQGLAEVLGLCYAAAAVVPRTALRAILAHGRHRAAPPRPAIHSDHLRQAALLYQEFGIAGPAALVSAGRREIADAEIAVLTGRHRELDLPRGPGDEVTTWLLDHFCGGLPSYVVSPLDLVLLDAVRDGAGVAEVCAAAGVPLTVGADRLARLSTHTELFALPGGIVTASILPRYREAEQQSGQPVLRWLAG